MIILLFTKGLRMIHQIESVYVLLDPKNTGTTPAIKETISRIVRSAFSSLNVDYKVFYNVNTKINTYSSLIIFISSPKRLEYLIKKVYKNNNILVVWNLEAISLIPETRAWNFMKQVLDFSNNDDINYIWHFAEHQLDVIKNRKISYLPLGIEESIVTRNIKKMNDVLFLGEITKQREKLLSEVYKGNFEFYNHGIFDYKDADSMLNFISSFRIGLDCMAEDNTPDYIRWHRIVLYGANNIVILTDNNLLDKYGFEEGVHYFKYRKDNALDLYLKINDIFENKELLNQVSKNMYSKLKEKFLMKNLLFNKLDECNIGIRNFNELT